MKKNLNVIQIKGVKGIIVAVIVVCCLIAGFIAFPGLVGMYLWNYLASYLIAIPQIGLFQGILLWAIILTSYFLLRKDRVIVCMKSTQGLSEEELKTVFADIKRQSMEDPILQSMLKAKEAELKYKIQQNLEIKDAESNQNSDNTNVS
ncbi:hypothetical protein IKB17_06105 [bacterium]|nr:hypothetical protein [bacterium]